MMFVNIISYYTSVTLPAGSGVEEEEEVAAALVVHDPVDWGLEAQVLTDCLLGGSPPGSGVRQAIPLYACNADLVYT